MKLAVNFTAFDDAPSGALRRAVGLSTGLVEAGHEVVILHSAHGSRFSSELGEELRREPDDSFQFQPVRLDPLKPALRAIRSGRVLRTATRDSDVLLTDYYPTRSRPITAVQIHDLRYLQESLAAPRLRRLWFRHAYPRLVRRSDLVIAVSEFVRAECRRSLGVADRLIHVVPNGLARCWLEAGGIAKTNSHLVAVSLGDGRKNLDQLLCALDCAATRGAVLPLHLVGPITPSVKASVDARPRLKRAGLVRLMGILSDSDLVRHVGTANALLHPSTYEGFGLPVVEAMSVGTRVVAAPQGAVVEVAADHPSYVDAQDTEGWVNAITDASRSSECAGAESSALRAARDHAARYTWKSAVDRLLDAVRAAETGRSRPT